MGNLNYIVFGGVDSRDYGIYISGEGVFNAPERDVEVVNIPGKDGDLLIDRGRFLNIQVTYPGFNFEPDLSTFAERLRAFRASLASQTGYQRLEDSFHPDEFRLASFRSGLDVNPIMYNTASTFDIVFDCKPQRFLKSGEEEIVLGEWGETETITGDIATFEAESNTAIKSLVANIEPIQSGTGDPSPTNVRPISGWSGVEVNRTGKNLWSPHLYNGMQYNPTVGSTMNFVASDDQFAETSEGVFAITFQNDWQHRTMLIPVAKDSHFAIDGVISCSGTIGVSYVYLDENFKVLSVNNDTATTQNINTELSPENILTTNKGYYAICFTNSVTANATITLNKPNCEKGTVHTTYDPYQGSTITKSLGQTVYGGTLDVVSGVLTVNKGFTTFNGSETWTASSGREGFYASLNALLKVANYIGKIVSNSLATYSSHQGVDYLESTNGITAYGKTNYPNQNWIYAKANGITTASDFKNWLSSNPLQVCYELATPLTYQLTPEQIETILGVNNIWADTGDVSVEIGEDPNILVNPTPFEALPLFEVVGTGSLTVGNTTIGITGDSTQDIFIDSDIMEAYEDDNGAIISRNDRINLSGTDFPKLGEETRVESNGLTSVKITPRWWTI